MKTAVWGNFGLNVMRMTTSHALTNSNISTSNFNSNPASDYLQQKRHKQHKPLSGIVTEAYLRLQWLCILNQNQQVTWIQNKIFFDV